MPERKICRYEQRTARSEKGLDMWRVSADAGRGLFDTVVEKTGPNNVEKAGS